MMDEAQRELFRRAASVIGHELRNPLAVINNSAYFVRAKLGTGDLDAKVAKHLGIIESEVARADKLLADMLAFSKPYEPMLETAAWDVVVTQTVKLFTEETSRKVEAKFGVPGLAVKIDAAKFQDALRRVLDNAMDATKDGGRIALRTGREKKEVFVIVTDSGPGVDSKVRETLFEPFITTKSRGLGLGLPLAKKFIEAGAGRIEVKSSKSGTEFRIGFPCD